VPIQTVFLDAGGVLVNPNWSRVGRVLAEHGERRGLDARRGGAAGEEAARRAGN
jgi:hypothetical protein